MNNKIELILNEPANRYIDMGDFDISLNYSFNDIRDISKRNGSYSKTIIVPATKNNNFVLGNLFDINSDFTLFNPNKKTSAKLLVNSETVMDGIMYLTQINKLSNVDSQGNSMYYELVLYTSAIDLLSSLGEKKLSDLTSLSEYNHTYNYLSVVNSWTNTEGYVYPMYGEQDQDGTYLTTNFFPATYYKTALSAILQESGYGWSGSLKDNLQFDKEIIPFTGNSLPKVSSEERLLRELEVRINTPFNVAFNGANITAVSTPDYWNVAGVRTTINVPYNTVFNDPRTQYNTTNSKWIVQVSGKYEINFQNRFTLIWSNINAGTVATQTGYKYDIIVETVKTSVSSQPVVIDTFTLKNNQAPLSITAGTAQTQLFQLAHKTQALQLIAGDIVELKLYIYKTAGNGFLDASGALSNITTVINFNNLNFMNVKSLSDILAVGETVKLQEFLPKLKQKDLLTDLIKRYNLIIYPDPENPNILIFDTYADYYANNTEKLDWTDKLDYSKEHNIKLLTELQNKSIKFTYTADKSVTDAGSAYTTQTGEIYGQKEVLFDNDFVTGEQLVQSPFSPTVTVKTAFGAYTPSINRDVPEGSPRVLYYGGLKDLTAANTFSLEGLFYSEYPYAGHFDDPINPTLDLNFDWCRFYGHTDYINLTLNNHFNTYWSAYINQIQDGKMLTAYFKLNEFDISKIKNKMSYKVWVKDAYYYINRVFDYNPLRNGVTKVELIKVNELGAYVDTNPYVEFVQGGEDCPIDIVISNGQIGFIPIQYYESLSGDTIDLDCCNSIGGIYVVSTGICRVPTTIGGKPTIMNLERPDKNLFTTQRLSVGNYNLTGGTSTIQVADIDENIKSFATRNKQLVFGDYNNTLYNNNFVIGDNNTVENSNISIINGSNNIVSSINTTVIGANEQTINDGNKIYLGDKLNVATKTGDMFIDGKRIDKVYTSTRRITSAEILEMDTVPIRLIDEPSSTQYVVMCEANMYLDFNTTIYSGDNDFEIYANTAEEIYFIGEKFPNADTTGVYDFVKVIPFPPATQSALGEAVYIRLKHPTSDGDSDIIVTILYRIVDVAGY